jgi:hypothetical protein
LYIIGQCIVAYWQHGSRWLGAIACPVCRQQVRWINFRS